MKVRIFFVTGRDIGPDEITLHFPTQAAAQAFREEQMEELWLDWDFACPHIDWTSLDSASYENMPPDLQAIVDAWVDELEAKYGKITEEGQLPYPGYDAAVKFFGRDDHQIVEIDFEPSIVTII